MTKKGKFDSATLDKIIADYSKPEDFADLFNDLKKAVIERALEGELGHHLGYPKHAKSYSENAKNSTSSKTLKTDSGEITINIPRDRNGEFEPMLVKKGQTRFSGFDKKIFMLWV